MKILLTINILCLAIFGFSQTDCQHNVSTEYTVPANDDLPIITPYSSNYYLNGFNWNATVGNVPNGVWQQYSLSNMDWAGTPLLEMNNINSQSISYYDYISVNNIVPYIHKNGWELLLVNLGRFPDDVNDIPTVANDKSSFPYIVLYNRYAGIVRVLANFGVDRAVGQGASSINISISFDDNAAFNQQLTGIYRIYNGIDQALDQPTGIQVASSIVPAPLEQKQWVSADFHVAYDPCTCFKPSNLKLNFELIQQSSINLHGVSLSQNVNLMDTDSTINDNITDFLNGFDQTSGPVTGNGLVMVKGFDASISEYIEKLEKYKKALAEVNEHNKQVQTNLAVLKAAKFITYLIVTQGASAIQAGAGAGAGEAAAISVATHQNYSTMNIQALQELSDLIAAGEDTPADSVHWVKDLENARKGFIEKNAAGQKIFNTDKILKAAKHVLGAEGDAFIANNFEAKKAPTAPTMPIVSLSEYTYNGQIISKQDLNSIQFYNPGTYGTTATGSPLLTSYYEYPVYNDVMGVFALLKTPEIEIYESDNDFVSSALSQQATFNSFNGLITTHVQRYEKHNRSYQISLASDLEYALNDVLDIRDYSIEAAYKIYAKPIEVDPNALSGSEKVKYCFQNSDANVNVLSMNSDADQSRPILAPLEAASGATSTDHIYNCDGLMDSLAVNGIDSVIVFETEFLPIGAFKPLTVGLGLNSEKMSSYSSNPYTETYLDQNYNSNYVSGMDFCTLELDPATSMLLFAPSTTTTNNNGFKYEFEIEVKLAIDVEFNTTNSDGEYNEITLLHTYKVPQANITSVPNPMHANLAGSSANFGQYAQDLYYDVTHFSGQDVNGCEEVNNHYTCRAWNNITINGDISTASGYSVEFIAGNKIEVLPEADITPEAIRRIESPLDFSQPMPKAIQSEVTAFCSNTNLYKANIPKSATLDDGSQLDDAPIEKNIEKSFDFALYPNPANSDLVTILIVEGYQDNMPFDIVVHDLSGRRIEINIQSIGSGNYTFDASKLSSGTYFVTGTTYGNKIVKRLIVN